MLEKLYVLARTQYAVSDWAKANGISPKSCVWIYDEHQLHGREHLTFIEIDGAGSRRANDQLRLFLNAHKVVARFKEIETTEQLEVWKRLQERPVYRGQEPIFVSLAHA